MAKIIVFTSGKGGVGVSSLTAAIGQSLSKKTHKTLIIDLDYTCGMIDTLLGVSADILFNLSDVFSNSCDFMDALKKVNENLFLLPAPQDILNSKDVSQLLDFVYQQSSDFDFILFDIPSRTVNVFKNIFTKADMVLLISDTGKLSVKATRVTADALFKISTSEIRLILNQFLAREFFAKKEFQNIDEIIDFTELQLIAIIPKNCKYRYRKMGNNKSIQRAIDDLSDRLGGEDLT